MTASLWSGWIFAFDFQGTVGSGNGIGDNGGLFKRDIRTDQEQRVRRGLDIFGIAAVEIKPDLSLQMGAQDLTAAPAKGTGPAGQVEIEHGMFSDKPFVYRFSNLHHFAGHLVAEDLG